MKISARILCALALLSVANPAFAHSYKQGNISIGHIWALATAPGVTTAAVHVPLQNNGQEQDKLLGASSPFGSKVALYGNADDSDDVTPLQNVVLDPGKPVSLQHGGIHLMIFGLKQQLKQGEMVPLTLQFEKAGSANVEIKIEATAPKN